MWGWWLLSPVVFFNMEHVPWSSVAFTLDECPIHQFYSLNGHAVLLSMFSFSAEARVCVTLLRKGTIPFTHNKGWGHSMMLWPWRLDCHTHTVYWVQDYQHDPLAHAHAHMHIHPGQLWSNCQWPMGNWIHNMLKRKVSELHKLQDISVESLMRFLY